MTIPKIQRDTLFIDMKYIILYRKLGYIEEIPDIFTYQYEDCVITIESEQQRFNFNNNKYPLKVYKDFVRLECIDRLLKKGYKASHFYLDENGLDLIIKYNDDIIFQTLFSGWDNYVELQGNYVHNHSSESIVTLYTSQLSGGLIDFKSKIYVNNEIYYKGIFEKNASLNEFEFNATMSENIYPDEYLVENDVLKKYLGNEKKVIIPDGITRIDAGVFWNMLFLEEVKLPEDVTCIAGDAFIYCENLKKINIPIRVSEIGDDPFAGCNDLVIENHSPYFIIDDDVLFDRDKKTLIHYIPQTNRKQYTIPKTVEWIGKHSFYKCLNLEFVTITKNVKFMGNNAFSDCPRLVLNNESPYFTYENGALYNREKTDLFHYSMGMNNRVFNMPKTLRKVGRNSFWNCKKLEKIVISESVREIGYNPFASCTNLTFENFSDHYSVNGGLLLDKEQFQLICCTSKVAEQGVIIPESVINIGRNAFSGCESLTHLDIPKGIRQISRGAFSGCINLEEIIIPKSVEKIEGWAFNGCIKLTKVYIHQDIKIANNAFYNCNAEVIIYD